jgi:hypothetical protein
MENRAESPTLEKRIVLEQLQETVLWHQMNKQLLSLFGSNIVSTDPRAQYLKKFCLDNSLLSKLGASSVTRDIPLSFFTNLSDLGFISLQDDQWEALLKTILGPIECFDLEQAQADYFEAITEYIGKFGLQNQISSDDADNDKDYYSCISEYLDKKELYPINLPQSVCYLHNLKVTVITDIMRDSDPTTFLLRIDNEIVLDFSRSHSREVIVKRYLECYCEQARYHINCVLSNAMSGADIGDCLSVLKNKYNNNPHVKTFINHERNIVIKELKLLNVCLADIQNRLEQDQDFRIRLCKSSRFHFLENPLPIA